jgi:hypothetical protein
MRYRILSSLAILSLLFLYNASYAQVGDIKKEIETGKENGSSSSSGGSNNGNYNSGSSGAGSAFVGNIIGGIFIGIGRGVGQLQRTTLEKKNSFPELISLETSLYTGLYPNENGNLYCPRIQGNWGIISSEFRYTYISDLSGKLPTLEWQILKINIPINPVKISLGMGFVNIPEYKSSYLETSARVDVWLWRRKINTFAEFRSTDDIIPNKKFRQEFNFQVDYNIKSYGRFHISPMIGIRQQSYLEKYDQTYFIAGCNFRIY